MAVQAIVLKHLAGAPPHIGARACVDDLELEDYERLFATRTIYTGFRRPQRGDALLYERVLGDAWAALPPALRIMHDGISSAEGRGRVDRGASPLAALAGALMSFPPAGADVPVRVTFEQTPRGEVWRRTFGRHSFQSHQYEGYGKSARLIVERFGALEFAMALVVEEGRVHLVTRRWSAFGIALPMWLAPRSNANEVEENGVFRFFVEISHPLTGLIVRYSGWLKPQPPGGRTE